MISKLIAYKYHTYSSLLSQTPYNSPNKLLTAVHSIRLITNLPTINLTALHSIRHLTILLTNSLQLSLDQTPYNSPNKLLTALHLNQTHYKSPNNLFTALTHSETLQFPNKHLTALHSIRHLTIISQTPYSSPIRQTPYNSPNKLLTALSNRLITNLPTISLQLSLDRKPYNSLTNSLQLSNQSDSLQFS